MGINSVNLCFAITEVQLHNLLMNALLPMNLKDKNVIYIIT